MSEVARHRTGVGDLTEAVPWPMCAVAHGRTPLVRLRRTARLGRRRTTLDTPCIQVCVVDPATRLCTGCGRTLAEIAQWSRLDAVERRRIMAELPERLRAMRPSGAR